MVLPSPNKDSMSLSLLFALGIPALMLLSTQVSPAFFLGFPALLAYQSLRSGKKRETIAGVIGLVLCGILLLAMAGYRIGKDMAERDNALGCEAKSGLSLP